MTLPRKDLFHLPDGVIYLDGNSLGPLPRSVPDRVRHVLADEWGEMLIGGWNDAGWMDQPARVGNRIGRLIGADENSVVIGDTLSIKVYQALASALAMRPERRVIVSDNGNFPTDIYIARGLIDTLGQGHRMRIVDPDEVEKVMDADVAAVLLTQVDYRTGRLHDLEAVTRRVHDAGAVMIWDLAHSAGALPVDVTGSGCEFAVGCTYKYLNAGPGAPAFIYVRPDLAETARPALQGWMGHSDPFAFDPDYRPAAGIERMRVGTPPILQIAALDAALDVWDDVSIDDIRSSSVRLCELFIAGMEAKCPDLVLASPRDPQSRGSQVSFRHPEGYAMIQALIARGVVGDFRAPDILRFGFTPLYLDEGDVHRTVEIIADILATDDWRNPDFARRSRVT